MDAAMPEAEQHTEAEELTITWEMVIWAGVLLLAAVLRLAQLGSAPLAPEEARNAFAAWSVYRGQPTDMPAGSLLTYGTAAIFFLFGVNDASARAMPAVGGVALVALPFLLRRQMGTVSALASAVFLAVSPSLVLYSRRVDGSVVVACLSLAVLTFSLKLAETRRSCWAYAAAIAFGALAVSGPVAYTAIFGLGCFGLALIWGEWPLKGAKSDVRRLSWPLLDGLVSEPARAVDKGVGEREIGYRYPVLAAVVGLLVATGLLSNLHGVQEGAVEAMATWARSLGSVTSARELSSVLNFLIVYELLPLLVGIAGVFALGRASVMLYRGLSWWLVAAFILASLSAGQLAGAVLLPLVPLTVLAGALAGQMLVQLQQRSVRVDLAYLALVAVPLLWLAVFVQGHLSRPDPVVPPIAGAVPLVFILLALAAFIFRIGFGRTYKAAVLLGLCLLGVMALHTTAILQRNDFEALGGLATSPDVRALVREIGDARDSARALGREPDVRVETALRWPLAWYLRDYNPVFGDSPQERDYLVVAGLESRAPGWPYVAQRYVLLNTGQSPPTSFGDWWLWYFYRDPIGKMGTFDAVLYVKV